MSEKNKEFILNNFKHFLEKSIYIFFSKDSKFQIIESGLIKLLKKMKKKTIQKPYFYIWKQVFSFYISIKLIQIKSNPGKKKYYIKNLNLNAQLKNSIKTLMLNRKEFKLFYYKLNNLNINTKKKHLSKIEKNKFNILNIYLNIIITV